MVVSNGYLATVVLLEISLKRFFLKIFYKEVFRDEVTFIGQQSNWVIYVVTNCNSDFLLL